MKKKTVKRLTLSRETLVRLPDAELAEAAAGVTEAPACCVKTPSCPPPSAEPC